MLSPKRMLEILTSMESISINIRKVIGANLSKVSIINLRRIQLIVKIFWMLPEGTRCVLLTLALGMKRRKTFFFDKTICGVMGVENENETIMLIKEKKRGRRKIYREEERE